MNPLSYRKQMKIFILLIMAVVLITSCSQPAASPSAPALSPGEVFNDLDLVVPARYDPPIDMRSVINVDATVRFLEGNDIHNNVWTQAYSELLGINVTYDWVVDTSMYGQKLSLSVNSGSIPDMFRVTSDQLLLFQEAGLLTDLTSIYEAEASENTREILTQDPFALKAATIEGKLWGIPLTDASVATASMLWVRQDWLDKLGLADPVTMDDFLEISRRFKEDDPNGSGVADTVGLCADNSIGGAIANLRGFFNGYHAYPGIWFERDGELVYGSIQPEMRAALAALQKMYANGELDQEFGVKDVNAVNEMIAQGKCGMAFGVWWIPYHPLSLSQQNYPQAFWSPFLIPSVDSRPAKSQYSTAVGSFLVVRNGYEHPEALIRMVNFWTDNIWNSQDDDLRNAFLGDIDNPDVVLYKYTPVVLWEPNALVNTGVALREALANRDPSGLDLEAQWRYRIIQAYFEQGILEAWVEVATNGPKGASTVLMEILEDHGILNRFYGPPTPNMAVRMPTLQSMEDEMIIKVIMGEPLDRFDQFVDDWFRLGGTDITLEVNQWAEN